MWISWQMWITVFRTIFAGKKSMESAMPDPELLKQLVVVKMPFGKYKDVVLCDLPVSYLEWFPRNGGFPKGKLGVQLATIYEIKINGLMGLLTPIRKMYGV
jgi:uncharacterized protein